MIVFKNFILLLLVTITIGKSSPLKKIYDNRIHIKDVYYHLNDGNKRDDTTTQKHYFLKYVFSVTIIDSSYAFWKEHEEKIVEEFIDSYVPIVNKYRKFHYYIQDSVTVSILISFLDRDAYRNLNGKNRVADALDFLVYRTYFSLITMFSDEIIDRLSRCSEPEREKLKLWALCKMPNKQRILKGDSIMALDTVTRIRMKGLEKRRDSLLSTYGLMLRKSYPPEVEIKMYKAYEDSLGSTIQDTINQLNERIREIESLPLWVRARLGDPGAEKKIIRGFHKTMGYQIERSAANASFAWTKECRKQFFTLFAKDKPICSPAPSIAAAIYQSGRPPAHSRYIHERPKFNICPSLQLSLLIFLARRHPDEPIFSNTLSSSVKNADFCKPEEQGVFFNEFAKWAKKKYGIELTFDKFTPYFRKGIARDKKSLEALEDACNK